MRSVLVTLVAVLVVVSGVGVLRGQDDESVIKPKHSIKEVMKEAHGKKLLNKVVDGSASKEEKDKLLDLYISLIDNEPSKGERGPWLMAAGRLTVAAARMSVGREGADAELKAASNCKACHQVFK